jgi:hypothetical protein
MSSQLVMWRTGDLACRCGVERVAGSLGRWVFAAGRSITRQIDSTVIDEKSCRGLDACVPRARFLSRRDLRHERG